MLSTMILSVVFVVLSSTVAVNGQTCDVTSVYGSCSSNSACGCLPIAQFDEVGICALLGVSCSRLSPCQLPSNTCEKTDHICVRYSRCDANPLCYPMAMIDQRLCPSIPASTTIRPSTNLISNYSSELTNDDETFVRPGSWLSGYYYETILVIVGATGTYSLRSFSHMNTYGLLYNGTFNPSNPSENLIGQDDQTGGNDQFELTAFLEAGVSYPLVFSTYGPGITGTFSIVASGSGNVYFIPINIQQTTTATTTSAFSNSTSTYFPWYITTSSQPLVISNYSDQLTNTSAKYPGTKRNYQAIMIMVNTSGTYEFTSVSDIDTAACLYQFSFYPSSPSTNQLSCNDDYIDNQFTLIRHLATGVSYILVLTSFTLGATGPFTVVGSGPDNVYFTPIYISNITETTSSPTISGSSVTSNYSSQLTVNSEKFPGINKYYEAIEIKINSTGTYTFTSVEQLDGIGHLYQPYFDPSVPLSNLIMYDDESGGNHQFNFTITLQAGVSYTLVITTYRQGVTGPFSIVASGPDKVQFVPVNSP